MKLTFLLFSTLLTLTIYAQEQQEQDSPDKDEVEQTKQIRVQKQSRSAQILGMSVTGNKESPRSLTIVPWRSPLMDGQSAEIQPVWQPQLGLLEPDSYRRNINLFLKQRKKRGFYTRYQ